jgi:hypothetical protein
VICFGSLVGELKGSSRHGGCGSVSTNMTANGGLFKWDCWFEAGNPGAWLCAVPVRVVCRVGTIGVFVGCREGGLLAQAWQPIVICGSALVGAMEGSRGAGWAFIPQSPCRTTPPPNTGRCGSVSLVATQVPYSGISEEVRPEVHFGWLRHK